jgi:hypothetical protein
MPRSTAASHGWAEADAFHASTMVNAHGDKVKAYRKGESNDKNMRSRGSEE